MTENEYMKENGYETIKDKTEQEKESELLVNIIKTKKELEENIKNFEFAEGDLIDYYTYQIKASKAKLDYLLKRAKELKLALEVRKCSKRKKI